MLPGLTHKMIDDEDQNTLLILEAVPEDSGVYECVAINQVGEARCSARLTIEGPRTPSAPTTPTTPSSAKEKPPVLLEPLKDIVVNEGESASFKCKITGVPRKLIIIILMTIDPHSLSSPQPLKSLGTKVTA